MVEFTGTESELYCWMEIHSFADSHQYFCLNFSKIWTHSYCRDNKWILLEFFKFNQILSTKLVNFSFSGYSQHLEEGCSGLKLIIFSESQIVSLWYIRKWTVFDKIYGAKKGHEFRILLRRSFMSVNVFFNITYFHFSAHFMSPLSI